MHYQPAPQALVVNLGTVLPTAAVHMVYGEQFRLTFTAAFAASTEVCND